jgi:hypothetical protein
MKYVKYVGDCRPILLGKGFTIEPTEDILISYFRIYKGHIDSHMIQSFFSPPNVQKSTIISEHRTRTSLRPVQ